MEKFSLLTIIYLFCFVNGNNQNSPDYIPDSLIPCNETDCVKPTGAYLKCTFNSIDTVKHKQNYSGYIYLHKTHNCCPVGYTYTVHALDITCVPLYNFEAKGCGVYPYEDRYTCREIAPNSMNPEKQYDFNCIYKTERCPTTCADTNPNDEECKCYPGYYWCSLQKKCILDEEYCDCGQQKVKCGDDKCLNPHLIKPHYKTSKFIICPDGKCIKSTGKEDCIDNKSACKDGNWKCGNSCPPEDDMKTYRACGNRCILQGSKCLKIDADTLKERYAFESHNDIEVKPARPSNTTQLALKSDIDISSIAIGTSIGGSAIVISIVAIFIYKWKKKRSTEILYVDDNPVYDYAAADYEYSATEIVDNNEYYEADSDEENKM